MNVFAFCIGSRAKRVPCLHGEPPHSGGESHGGIQNAVEFPCGNSTPCPRRRRGRIQFRTKFNWVEIVPESQNPFQTESNLIRALRARGGLVRSGTIRVRGDTKRRLRAAGVPASRPRTYLFLHSDLDSPREKNEVERGKGMCGAACGQGAAQMQNKYKRCLAMQTFLRNDEAQK